MAVSDDHLREVIELELATLSPDIRLDATKMDGLVDQDLCEIGASGRFWPRAGRSRPWPRRMPVSRPSM